MKREQNVREEVRPSRANSFGDGDSRGRQDVCFVRCRGLVEYPRLVNEIVKCYTSYYELME